MQKEDLLDRQLKSKATRLTPKREGVDYTQRNVPRITSRIRPFHILSIDEYYYNAVLVTNEQSNDPASAKAKMYWAGMSRALYYIRRRLKFLFVYARPATPGSKQREKSESIELCSCGVFFFVKHFVAVKSRLVVISSIFIPSLLAPPPLPQRLEHTRHSFVRP